MQRNTVDRRLDLLRLEGEGFNKVEIVKELVTKYACSKQTIYNDFKNKPIWQPALYLFEQVFHKIINRNEQLYRVAYYCYRQCETVRDKLMVLNLLRVLIRDSSDFVKETGYKPKQVKPPDQPVIKWQDPEDWQQQYYQSVTVPTTDKQLSTLAKQDSGSSLAEEGGEKQKRVQTKHSVNP